MKTCKSCDNPKEDHEFYYTSMRYYSSICQECKDWSFDAKTKVAAGEFKNLDQARKARNKTYMWTYLKTNPCVDCGEADIIVLEFDHLPKYEKTWSVSDLANSTASIKHLKDEILRCDVVCANCHRRRTATRAGWNKEA